jgi:hypothetical protein
MDMDEDGDETQDQLVKKLVRYALACEYSRTSIKREGIRERGMSSWQYEVIVADQ